MIKWLNKKLTQQSIVSVFKMIRAELNFPTIHCLMLLIRLGPSIIHYVISNTSGSALAPAVNLKSIKIAVSRVCTYLPSAPNQSRMRSYLVPFFSTVFSLPALAMLPVNRISIPTKLRILAIPDHEEAPPLQPSSSSWSPWHSYSSS